MNDAYPLTPFRIGDPGLLRKIMRQWPLATLISGETGNACISLIPVMAKDDPAGDIHLLGHLDANNEHALAIRAGAPISFQFTGPDAYASPDLYASLQLPGWLYVSVKGDGIIESIMDQAQLKSLLHESTTVFGGAGQQFHLDADDERIDRFIGGINVSRMSPPTVLFDKDEFAGRGLKRWRNVPIFSRNLDIARWAGSYNAN